MLGVGRTPEIGSRDLTASCGLFRSWCKRFLHNQAAPWHTLHVTSKAKKTKRDNRIVAYIRLKPEEHARITKIAEKRGYPHTFASVAGEMITRGLATEVQEAS